MSVLPKSVCLLAVVVGLLAQRVTLGQDGSQQNLKPLNAAPLEVVMRMDCNGDGVLEPGEVPLGAENFVFQIATEAGLGTAQSYDLVQLSLAWLRFDQERQSESLGSTTAEFKVHDTELSAIPWTAIGSLALTMASANAALGIDPELEALARLDANHDGRLQREEVPIIAQQAVAAQLKAHGYSFNRPVVLKELAAQRQRARLQGRTAEAKQTVPADAAEIKRNARRLLETYDDNQNNYLEASEWSRLAPEWGQADRNRDRRLSVAEVAAYLESLTRAARRE